MKCNTCAGKRHLTAYWTPRFSNGGLDYSRAGELILGRCPCCNGSGEVPDNAAVIRLVLSRVGTPKRQAVKVTAIDECGEVLLEKVSSSRGYAQKDAGINSTFGHLTYSQRFPNGYQLTVVDNL